MKTCIQPVAPFECTISNQKQTRCAFTLIDLLVLVVIIALLAAVLLPAGAASKLKPQQIECMANLKQLAVAGNLYVGDFGKFMQPSGAHSALGANGEWFGALLNYFNKNTNVLLCPTAPTPVPQPVPVSGPVGMGNTPGLGGNPTVQTYTGAADHCYIRALSSDGTLQWNAVNCSYTYNGWMYTNPDGTGGGDGKALEQASGVTDPAWYYGKENTMEQPSVTPYFVDGLWDDAWPTEKDHPPKNLYYGMFAGASNLHVNEIGRFIMQRHGTVNPVAAARNYTTSWAILPPPGAEVIALADGHVELTTLVNLYAYRWHKAWNPALVNLQILPPY